MYANDITLTDLQTLLQKIAESTQNCTRGMMNILRIWGMGGYFLAVKVSENLSAEEAFAREACMTKALGRKHLTNRKIEKKTIFSITMMNENQRNKIEFDGFHSAVLQVFKYRHELHLAYKMDRG